MKKLVLVAVLAASLLAGCTAAPKDAPASTPTPVRETVTLLDNEQLTITTNGLETVLQDHASGTKTTYRKALKLKQEETQATPAEPYTARESHPSEAATVYIRGGVLVIVTDGKTFVI